MLYDDAYQRYLSRYGSPATASAFAASDYTLEKLKELQIEILLKNEEDTNCTRDEICGAIREANSESIFCLDFGLGRISAHLQHQSEELRTIISTLEQPLAAKAREVKRRAEFAYKNGWTDEAINDFLRAARINYQDFSVHMYLGNLYFFDKGDVEQGLQCYLAAAKYAQPHSRSTSARALTQAAFVKRMAADGKAAYALMQEALRLAPNLSDVLYEAAVASVLTGANGEAIGRLKRSIELDRLRALKALADPDLRPLGTAVRRLVEELGDECVKRTLKKLDSLDATCDKLGQEGLLLCVPQDEKMALEKMCSSPSYLHRRKALDRACDLEQRFYAEVRGYLVKRIQEADEKVQQTEKELKVAVAETAVPRVAWAVIGVVSLVGLVWFAIWEFLVLILTRPHSNPPPPREQEVLFLIWAVLIPSIITSFVWLRRREARSQHLEELQERKIHLANYCAKLRSTARLFE